MIFNFFFIGIGFLIVAYFLYRYVKNQKPSSEKTNWEGLTLSTYAGIWGIVIMCTLFGIGFIFKSLPAQI